MAHLQWNDIESDAQNALLTWLNLVNPSAGDKRRLAKLYESKRFWFWECILCDEQCVHGEPEDWGHFQGVHDDLDMSYFGNRDVFTEAALMSMCNTCRCYKCGVIPDGSPAWDLVEELGAA